MSVFHNNLREGDPVMNVKTGKLGKVVRTPQTWDRKVQVLTYGKHRQRVADIADLRFVVDGEPEDVAPYDGELPA